MLMCISVFACLLPIIIMAPLIDGVYEVDSVSPIL